MIIKSKILVVDDNPNDLLAYREFLGNENIEIITANSGENALRKLMIDDFSLIIMDVQMPGMSGFETVQIIKGREKSKDIPVIFITGEFKQNDFKKYGFEIGGFDYIIKPVDSLTLENKVKAFLNLFNQKRESENANRELKKANQILNEEIAQREKIEIELKKTMEALKSSNLELEQFAYIASHDLQEPLRMVASFLQLLASRYKDKLDSNANEFIDFAVEGASRMQKMIQDLLEYSRIQTQGKQLEKTDTSEILSHIISNLQTKIEETGTIILSDKLPVLIGDESQLKRLFQNLITNAIKFCIDKKPQIFISAKQENDEWIFSFKDNGIGIDQQYQNKVFQIFQRLHTREEFGGTGIGLAICKRIVERHNGKIWFESKPGEGTTFYFTIKNQGEN
jgi:two-component system, sensor histidine kinase and response regulator